MEKDEIYAGMIIFRHRFGSPEMVLSINDYVIYESPHYTLPCVLLDLANFDIYEVTIGYVTNSYDYI